MAACHGDHRRVAGREPALRQEGALFRSGVDEHEFRQLRILRVGDLDPVPYARPGFDQRVNPRAVGVEVERILRFRAVCAHQFQLDVVLLGRRQIADFRKRFALNGRKFDVSTQFAEKQTFVRLRDILAELRVVDPVEFAAFGFVDEDGELVSLDGVFVAPGREIVLRIGRQFGGGDRRSLREIDDQGYVARQRLGGGSLLADGDGLHPVDARGRDRDAAEPLLFAVRTGCRGGYADGRVARAFGPVEREAPAGCHGLPGGGRRDGEGLRGAGFGAQQDVVRADRQRRRVFVVVAAAGGHGKGGRQQQQACEGPRESECLHKIIFFVSG